MGQTNSEPSMEDILASIKRIIAEDSEAPPRAARVRKGPVAVPDPEPAVDHGDDFAEIPEPSEPEAVAEPDAAIADPVAVPGEPGDVLELTSPLPEPDEKELSMSAIEQQSTPAAAQAQPPRETAPPYHASTRAAAPSREEAIMSGAVVEATRSAFAALNQLQIRAETGKENTLEGLVVDLLRPMLRDYLDRELPALVERLVAAEVRRASGRD